ncbi:flagellar brake protein [Alicyclobacillus ferrooxydans]|uniref:PilZ domain-containing protein n=1 Tax=Alicyclobacillus ferrooxydans TaxID=471514 RepID=A0A0P9D1Y8_9BACL|nr:PilZ domain-containing protein [Alicyclobacillus ferrooxydans]KPV43550.1 hypothetical protein AN477_12180 [Alicyclobacillus ferrooxydans]
MQLPLIGQPLRIRMHRNDESYFRTRLLDVHANGLVIDVPILQQPITGLTPGHNFWVEFHGTGGLCRFPSTLLAVNQSNGTSVSWVIKRPEETQLERDQRREFVRVETDLPVRIEFTHNGVVHTLDVRSRDLSGGGISLSLPKHSPLQIGYSLICRFILPRDQFPVETQGVLLRLEEREDNASLIGSIHFENIQPAIQKKIIQYTFWRQRFLLEVMKGKRS